MGEVEEIAGQVTQGNKNKKIAISMEKVNKWFGALHVLRDVTITVAEGERVVVCGPSGSGKSTLIRCLNWLETHQQGRIVIDGIELTESPRARDSIRAKIGMVFQSFNLFPHLTILENCTLAPVSVRKMSRKQAEELAMSYLQRVKIADQAKKYPGQLSGGQQQRLCIARALAIDPDVLLMDEPTSALDPLATAKIEDLIGVLSNDYTIAMVSHNMQQAARVSNYTAFMLAGADRIGRLVEFGETNQMFTRPQERQTEDYITGRFG